MTTSVPVRPLSFEAWKDHLCRDCATNQNLEAFNCLGDFILKLLYESGVAPTVDAIAKDKDDLQQRSA